MDAIKFVEQDINGTFDYPDFKAGDNVAVSYKIREGNKERIQVFQGTVIQRRGSGLKETFTVRKVSGGMGVERIFPMSSPFIESIKVNKSGSVRRARIFYLRERTGKSARIKERIFVKKETAQGTKAPKAAKAAPAAKESPASTAKEEKAEN